ncbi:MAG: DUF1592 domain-containing protein [Opitutales bacterium]|nr:DUF1592 domain-containing protein [Opitutales bacterium]
MPQASKHTFIAILVTLMAIAAVVAAYVAIEHPEELDAFYEKYVKQSQPDVEELEPVVEHSIAIASPGPAPAPKVMAPKPISTEPEPDLDALFAETEDEPHVEMATAQPTDVDPTHMQPFLENNCISCHGPDKQKGQLRFDTIDWTITNNDHAQHWQDILDVLNADEMPPEEEPRPEKEELLAVLNSLTKTLLTARMRLTDNGGVITMRHLNRREYVNSIRDLFGINISHDMIPEDTDSGNFDTVGSDQYFSSVRFDRYLEFGTRVASQGLKWSARPMGEPKTVRHQPEKRLLARMEGQVKDASAKMKLIQAGKTWQEIGFNDAVDMKLFKDRYDGRFGSKERYLELPNAESGIYIYNGIQDTRSFTVHNDRVDPRGVYRVKVNAGTLKDTHPERHFLYISGVESLGVLKVTGTEFRPEIQEILFTPKLLADDSRNQLKFSECAPVDGFSAYLKKIGDTTNFSAIWVDWVELEGPFYGEKENFFGNLISKDGLGKPEKARELIEKFAYKAFRHKQPEPEYVDKLHAFFEQTMSQEEDYNKAMSQTLGVILTSPGFLYVEEAPTDNRRLSPREFAIRLAFFLWSSPPDDELYRLAENGALFEEGELKRQVTRMLTDRKADAFYEGFMGQWAELDRFQAISVDRDAYFRYNQAVQTSASREVTEFFEVLVKENLPVDNLIDSNFVVINSHLANYYGIQGVRTNEFQKVSIPANSNRGGFITQAAFLTMGSNGERSSPVIRGTMVLDKILNDPPAPPPPNVPELGSNIDTPLPNRKMVEMHQTQTVCASCHSRIDPIGFGMENYDAIGMYRTHEKVGKFNEPIERGGKLVSGIAYRDMEELKSLLKTQKHKLAKEFVESLVSYGIGRTIEFSDTDAILDLVNKCQYDGYALQNMIYKVVSSQLFISK